MLSRVANSIFWIFRYIERAENNARFLDVNFNLVLDLPPGLKEQWMPLIVTTGSKELYDQIYQGYDKQDVIRFIGFDDRNPNSIFSCISNARENARMVRENLTKEVWEEINEMYLLISEAVKRGTWKFADPRNFFTQIKKGCQVIYGLNESTLSHAEGWNFGQVGQMLERADNTSRVLDVKYHILLPSVDAIGSPIDLIHWSALLKSVSAYNMYKRKNGRIIPAKITEFLILDPDFPRSILYCLRKAEASLREISGIQSGGFSNPAEKKLGAIRSEMEFFEINDIILNGLHEYLDNLQSRIGEVSNSIYDCYFSATKN
jgi:uncharacterized alpha-E superfamily protein